YCQFLQQMPDNDESLLNVCWTAAVGRDHLPFRVAVIGANPQELRDSLVACKLPSATSSTDSAGNTISKRYCAVFSGMGTQWPGMGIALYERYSLFRETIIQCDGLLQPLFGFSLQQRIFCNKSVSELDIAAAGQPALFAMQVALWRLW